MPFTALPDSDVALCVAALVATLLAVTVPGLRDAAATLFRHVAHMAKAASAIVAHCYDLVLPVSQRSAAVSKPALAAWSASNLVPVLAWIFASQNGSSGWQPLLAATTAFLALLNALLRQLNKPNLAVGRHDLDTKANCLTIPGDVGILRLPERLNFGSVR